MNITPITTQLNALSKWLTANGMSSLATATNSLVTELDSLTGTSPPPTGSIVPATQTTALDDDLTDVKAAPVEEAPAVSFTGQASVAPKTCTKPTAPSLSGNETSFLSTTELSWSGLTNAGSAMLSTVTAWANYAADYVEYLACVAAEAAVAEVIAGYTLIANQAVTLCINAFQLAANSVSTAVLGILNGTKANGTETMVGMSHNASVWAVMTVGPQATPNVVNPPVDWSDPTAMEKYSPNSYCEFMGNVCANAWCTNFIVKVIRSFCPVFNTTYGSYTLAQQNALIYNSLVSFQQATQASILQFGSASYGQAFAGTNAPPSFAGDSNDVIQAGYGMQNGVVAWFQKISSAWSDATTWESLASLVNLQINKIT
jgi:hypothetical protein